AENITAALNRTTQIKDACNTAVASMGKTCTATLLYLFMRSQTEGSEGATAVGLLNAASTDGVYT
ncbi:MAG TPA: hypothetical protein DEU95_12690, partial [Chloroflexi bacterium]|nr:hypothetical protein [Chloroflexota bacterium]